MNDEAVEVSPCTGLDKRNHIANRADEVSVRRGKGRERKKQDVSPRRHRTKQASEGANVVDMAAI